MTDSSASLATSYRSHTCGALRASDTGGEVRLAGWVHRRRDHGQLIFLDLRDRHGITQIVIDAADAPDAHATASTARSEYVVMVQGTVARLLSAFDLSSQGRGPAMASGARIHPTALISPEARLAENVEVGAHTVIEGKVTIGPDCVLRPGVFLLVD